MANSNEQHYCMLPVPQASEGKTRAALLDETKWQPGTQIKVRFMEGDAGTAAARRQGGRASGPVRRWPTSSSSS